MTFEELQREWASDAQVDIHNLGVEALKIPKLHSKYYEYFISAKYRLAVMKNQVTELEFILEQFFAKTLTAEELNFYGLEYSDKVYLKQEIPKLVNCHRDMLDLKLKIAVQQEKVDFLKSVIGQISNRSFIIRDAIEFAKFESGG